MAVMSTTNFADIMKTYYLAGINDNTVRSKFFLNKLQRNHEITGGNFAYLALLRRGNPGVGARAEGASLPTASFSRHAKATFKLKSLYGRFALSGQSMRQSKQGDRAAFATALDTQMQSLMEDLPSQHNRQLYGDGSGALTVIGATEASQTSIEVAASQYLTESDIIDIRNTTTGALAAGGGDSAVVSFITASNSTTIELAAVATCDADDSIYFEDSRNQEMFGLQATHSASNPASGNYGNIDRTTGAGAFYQGNVLGNSGTNRPLTRALVQQGITTSAKKGKGVIDNIMSDPDVWITYGNLMAPDQRYTELIKTMDGGWQYLLFAGVPWTWDVDCPPNRVFLTEMKSLMIFEHEGGYQWLDMDGAILKWIVDKDQWQAVLVKDTQLGCNHCNRMVQITDIAINLN